MPIQKAARSAPLFGQVAFGSVQLPVTLVKTALVTAYPAQLSDDAVPYPWLSPAQCTADGAGEASAPGLTMAAPVAMKPTIGDEPVTILARAYSDSFWTTPGRSGVGVNGADAACDCFSSVPRCAVLTGSCGPA